MKRIFKKISKGLLLTAVLLSVFHKGQSQTINLEYSAVTASSTELSYDVSIANLTSNTISVGAFNYVVNFPSGTINPAPVPVVTYVKGSWWPGTITPGWQNSGSNLLKARANTNVISPANAGPTIAPGVTQFVGRITITATGITISHPSELILATAGNPTLQIVIDPDGAGPLPAFTATAANMGIVLPVELEGFTATAQPSTNLLKWSTATELNSEHHIVERSADGIGNWQEVGRKTAAGNSQVKQYYEFEDKQPLPMGYYRLKLKDFGGWFVYSKVVNVRRHVEDFAVANVFPVPANQKVTLQVALTEAANLGVTVTDIVGRVLQVSEMDADRGLNNLEVDLSQFAAGTYFVKIDNGVKQLTERIVKQ